MANFRCWIVSSFLDRVINVAYLTNQLFKYYRFTCSLLIILFAYLAWILKSVIAFVLIKGHWTKIHTSLDFFLNLVKPFFKTPIMMISPSLLIASTSWRIIQFYKIFEPILENIEKGMRILIRKFRFSTQNSIFLGVL